MGEKIKSLSPWKKQLILSSCYFILSYLVFGFIYMVLFPIIIPKQFLIPMSAIGLFGFSSVVTIAYTYEDYREKIYSKRVG